jgi:stress response protein YsnF
MDEKNEESVIPIIHEEVHADAVPVVTGGVRVTKSVDSHDEIVEQALRKSHAEVKRVITNRVADGPQSARRVGDTLIVPVVSEVLKIEKQWVVTEEIHITERQEQETVQNKVTLNREHARVERLDRSGNTVSTVPEMQEDPSEAPAPVSILKKKTRAETGSKRTSSRSILRNRGNDTIQSQE